MIFAYLKTKLTVLLFSLTQPLIVIYTFLTQQYTPCCCNYREYIADSGVCMPYIPPCSAFDLPTHYSICSFVSQNSNRQPALACPLQRRVLLVSCQAPSRILSIYMQRPAKAMADQEDHLTEDETLPHHGEHLNPELPHSC